MRKLIKIIFTSVVLLELVSCSLVHKPNITNGGEASSLKVISLKNEFNSFWKAARDQSFDRRIEVWTSLVEQPHQQFFDYFIWSGREGDNFSERRKKQLKAVFKRIEKNEAKVKQDLENFESTIKDQVARYHNVFPDFNAPVTCYAVVGGNFLGRAGTAPWNNEKVMAFGIEKLADMKVNADIIYSHEIFHVYHGSKSNIDSDQRMIAQLWSEGLASFVSHELNPNAPIKDIFIYPSTAKVKNNQLPKIASMFLGVANKAAFDPASGKAYFNWFLDEKESNNGLPAMAGYWLGFKVVEKLRTQYTLAQMASWDSEKASKLTTSILHQFTQNKASH